MIEDVILVNILKDVTQAITPPSGIGTVNFQAGRNLQILNSLTGLDESITLKGNKYPLIAVFLPIIETRGRIGYYAQAKIRRIIISTITVDDTEIKDRFGVGETYQTVLYPIYYEFLNRLAQSPNIIGSDPLAFVHDKMDNPGVQPIGKGSNDYIDSIEIMNLELILNQIKTC